jgi:hypothetical protein
MMDVARMAWMRILYKIFVSRSEGKKPLGRPRRICKDNSIINLKVRGLEAVDRLIWLNTGTDCGLL